MIFLKNGNFMYKRLVFSSLLVCFLSGCDGIDKSYNVEARVAISALPIFQQEVVRIRSIYPGGSDVMNHVCLFAGDEINSVVFNNYASAFIKSDDVGGSQLLKKWSDNKVTKKNLATACTAYVLSSLYTERNIADFLKLNESRKMDLSDLKKITPIMLESIKITASILNHNQDVFGDETDFRDSVAVDIENKSLDFVRKVMKLKLDGNSFSASGSDSGYVYAFNNGITNLYLYGESWFGSGKVMGVKYNFYIKSINDNE